MAILNTPSCINLTSLTNLYAILLFLIQRLVFTLMLRSCSLSICELNEYVCMYVCLVFCNFVLSRNEGLDKTVQSQIYRGLLKTDLTCRQFSSYHRRGQDKTVLSCRVRVGGVNYRHYSRMQRYTF